MTRIWPWLTALALSLALVVAFNQPLSVVALGTLESWRLPLEPVVALLVLALLPGRIWSLLIAGVLGAMLWLRLGDQLVWQWMGRPFTAIFDIPLGLSLVEIGFAALGWPLTLGLAFAAFVILPLAAALAWAWQRHLAEAPRALILGLAALTAVLFGLGRLEAMPNVTTAHGFDQLRLQFERSRAGLEARERWRTANAVDPVRDIPEDQLLTGLADTDVLLFWIESVGRSCFHPRALQGADAEPARRIRGRPRRPRPRGGLGLAGLAHHRRPVLAGARDARFRCVDR
jgi:hypothetical protein